MRRTLSKMSRYRGRVGVEVRDWVKISVMVRAKVIFFNYNSPTFNRHLTLLKTKKDPVSCLCGEEYDTSLHLLGRCGASDSPGDSALYKFESYIVQ